MLSTVFRAAGEASRSSSTRRHTRQRSTCFNERIYDAVNNGVYKAGFSTRQEVYERAVAGVFGMLDELDAERLLASRFLFGAEPRRAIGGCSRR